MEDRNKARPVTISLYPAQIRELENLEEAMGVSKSDLIQQAVNVLIAQFKEALGTQRDTVKTQKVD